MTRRPIVDRAEVAIDFPDKSYLGSFTRHSAFEAENTDALVRATDRFAG